jgi:hypothetical protein
MKKTLVETRHTASLRAGFRSRDLSHKTNVTCYKRRKVGKVANAARRGPSKTQVSRKTELPELGIRILKRAYKGEWRKALDLLKQN